MRSLWRILLLALVCVASPPASACPACNIYNYLARSVAQSTNILVGKLTERSETEEAKVEVIRTLHGSHRAGQTIEMRVRTWPENVGGTFIFSDPVDDPNFPLLETEFEDEVRFLIRLADLERETRKKALNRDLTLWEGISPEALGRYGVSDAEEAIRRVQGWSNESKEIGMEYLNKCNPFPTSAIIGAIESMRKDLFAGKEVPSEQNRLGNLVEALMLTESKEADDYVLEQTQTCLRQEAREVDWSKFPIVPSSRGKWQTKLLGLAGKEWTHRSYSNEKTHRKARPNLVEKQKRMVYDALPRLRGLGLSEAVYALYETQNASLEQLLPLFKDSQRKDELALGVLWSAGRRVAPWYREKPVADLEMILSLASNPELKRRISEKIQQAGKW